MLRYQEHESLDRNEILCEDEILCYMVKKIMFLKQQLKEKKNEVERIKHEMAIKENEVINQFGSPYEYMKFHQLNKKEFLYRLQDKCCNYCHNKCDIKKMTMEHLIPKSYGGTQKLGNICLVCKKCNRIRSNNMSDPDFIDVINRRLDIDWWRIDP